MNALTLPDIAVQTAQAAPPLDWVGMAGIAVPLLLAGQRLTARADAGVSLDDGAARGIHMSRLYLALDPLAREPLSPVLLRAVLQRFLDSHQDLSRRAYLNLHGELLLSRPALVSPLAGWKGYPFSVRARLQDGALRLELRLTLAYSSTCPCSAALARQLVQQRFEQDFAGRPLDHAELHAWLGSPAGMVATPHSQRSTAELRLRLADDLPELPVLALLDGAEDVLGTAVQTAVKRADEQAFALANGQNLMFCEDAARRLHHLLRHQPGVAGFQVRVVHAESLHAHDAVAESTYDWEVR
jgi:GTP cyclohydrolase I